MLRLPRFSPIGIPQHIIQRDQEELMGASL